MIFPRNGGPSLDVFPAISPGPAPGRPCHQPGTGGQNFRVENATWHMNHSLQSSPSRWKIMEILMENDGKVNDHWISRDSRDVRDVLVHLFGNDFLQPSEMWESSQMAWLIGMSRGRYLENPSRNQRLENPRTKCRFPAGKIIEREILDFQLPRLIIRV